MKNLALGVMVAWLVVGVGVAIHAQVIPGAAIDFPAWKVEARRSLTVYTLPGGVMTKAEVEEYIPVVNVEIQHGVWLVIDRDRHRAWACKGPGVPPPGLPGSGMDHDGKQCRGLTIEIP